ncbi:hypothetical protein Cob_v001407 [Colletotrichum orbiculare MAFF 240422]|uniref:Uncharacterized protein n=1 Tax=Colletotrichum orbiculare (strain 104-T / ATCC 96160 / CBS 514.97 / LARS 414 / MAFF 240422) TaxID=1213857 RepID=N4VE99_COLOR|nr:hypothetical protein Cob_v001407 [Colletotrichum orbiculare MAFF 240422]
MNKEQAEIMASNPFPEDQSAGVRSPLPQYQNFHTPPSTMGCSHHTGAHSIAHQDAAPSCHPSHGHIVQPCHPSRDIYQASRANLVPLPLLGKWPALVECPGCQGVAPTTTEHTIGKGTHWMAVMLFFTTGLGVFVPYSTNTFKNVRHNCLRCGRVLATKRFGGGTRAHLM